MGPALLQICHSVTNASHKDFCLTGIIIVMLTDIGPVTYRCYISQI